METRRKKRVFAERTRASVEAELLAEVLILVIRFLDFRDRTSISLVCKNWRKWSWQQLQTALLKVGRENEACVFLQRNCPSLERLVCEIGANLSEATIPASLQHLVVDNAT